MSTQDSADNKSIGANIETSSDQVTQREKLKAQLDELESRLAALEGVFSDRVVDKEQAHVEAQKQHAREKLSVGDRKTVVVEEPAEQNCGSAVTHIGGIVTFIKQATDATQGESLDVRVTDVQENCAHAVCLT